MLIWTHAAAATAFKVPHLAFGSELTENYAEHQRTLLFTWRSGGNGLGSLLGIGALFALMGSEPSGPTAVRSMARLVALIGGGLAALSVLVPVVLLPEARPTEASRVHAERNPVRVVALVWRSELTRRMTGLWWVLPDLRR